VLVLAVAVLSVLLLLLLRMLLRFALLRYALSLEAEGTRCFLKKDDSCFKAGRIRDRTCRLIVLGSRSIEVCPQHAFMLRRDWPG
jgi:hypothetical protein